MLKEIVQLSRGPARLAALKVLMTLSQWDGFIDKLVRGDITEGLVMIACEASEFLRELEQFEERKLRPFSSLRSLQSPQRSNSMNRLAREDSKGPDRTASFGSVSSSFIRSTSRGISQGSQTGSNDDLVDYNIIE